MNKSHILIFRGIHFADLAAEFQIFAREQPRQVYSDIPKRFESVDQWPEMTNLRCWECDQLPDSYPRFIPINLKDNSCDVYGNFCSWNCAVAYANKCFPVENRWDIMQAICIVESKFSGVRRAKIPPSPPKTLMKAYCGNEGISLREWRELVAKVDQEQSIYVNEYNNDLRNIK